MLVVWTIYIKDQRFDRIKSVPSELTTFVKHYSCSVSINYKLSVFMLKKHEKWDVKQSAHYKHIHLHTKSSDLI